MEFFKVWILPPLVGATIGYFTNWLAIKMLFRPLQPVYLGRFRLPFTPGILPRERQRLTMSIAETVSSEILTTEVFTKRLEDPALESRISASVFRILAGYLQADASVLLKAASAAAGDVASAEKGAGSILGQAAASLFESPEFRASVLSALADAAPEAARMAGSIRMSAVLPPDILERYAEELAASGNSGSMKDLLDSLVEVAFDPARTGRPLVTAGVARPVIGFLADSAYRRLLPVSEQLLASRPVQERLNDLGVKMLRSIIGRLGPLQRLFVTAANYERNITETMPDTIRELTDSIIGLLRQPDTRTGLVTALQEQLAEIPVSPGPGTFDGFFPRESLKAALKSALEGLEAEKERFAGEVRARYSLIAEKNLEEILPGFARLLSDAIMRLASIEPSSAPGPSSATGLSPVVGPGFLPLLNRARISFLDSYAGKVEGRSLASILCLDDAKIRVVSDFLSVAICRALASQATQLVDALDVAGMVRTKIDELDMAEVERIILKVISRELSWITLLGGILGGVIGIVQSLISLI
jgi:hypothetical protein